MADMAGIMGEIEERNSELESENARLREENERLNSRVEKLQQNLANTVHKLTLSENGNSEEMQSVKKALCECEHRLAKTTKELNHVKNVLRKKNIRYQEDCITINRLQVTIETLVEQLSRKMRR